MRDRTLYLYHITPKNNWMGIGVHGLMTDYSNGAIPAVWLVDKRRIRWAIHHTADRHGIRHEELIVVRVRVRRSWLRKNKVRGAWYCLRDIQPCRIEWIKAWPPLHIAIETRGFNIRMLRDRML